VYILDPAAFTAISGIRRASAFPPNFIYSLDATHLMLSMLECGVSVSLDYITFVLVHDSYWTHVSSIDQTSEVIRDLHSSNILCKLEAE
ncbi:DNA-dependent RNA polymerase-domain-containing protein, partial [Boletus coccyginus]